MQTRFLITVCLIGVVLHVIGSLSANDIIQMSGLGIGILALVAWIMKGRDQSLRREQSNVMLHNLRKVLSLS
jgi:hypothetical protein